ncbi:hypothetical protein J3R82DRAFT_8899 [Butyriboletus roseoflavus]|nr:hypothetical protein J3R82DRAFT_8899 [Butyriboletus roseoflavus]
MSSLPSQLYGEPFISTRECIAWIPSTPAFEDSDVLVLSSRSTSPGEVDAMLFYLDLRLSLPLGRTSKVNWGFAGLRHTLSTSPLRYRWNHSIIDSRDDGAADEGQMIQRDGKEIETGIGLNPATGQMEAYEEIWRDEPLPEGSSYIFVSSSASVEEATATMAVLGPHALALAQEPRVEAPNTPRNFRAVRMHRRMSPVQDTQGIVWETVFSTGSSAQERELKELVELADQGCQYVRGNNIYLGSRSWVVWDTSREGT